VILGKDKTAFKLLHDFIISAKRRGQWTIVFEKIMTLYLNLAIKLGNFSMIRDGLAQYRYMSQTSNINSLELIIIYYRDRMESLFYEKLARFSEGKLIEMEDIDNEDSPENLFLTSIDLKSKCEREEIKSFMKNLWDSYKIIIEIVRTNNKLEEILTTTSDKIFAFCQKFKRKVEFKRFSESLRYYVSKIIKNMALYPDYLKNPFAVDITENETNERYLTIFSQQMKTALNLKLWQEAFKICEDMNAIIKIRRGVLKPKFLSNYFENLAKVFWNSEYYLYHANAFYSHYTIYKKFSKANTTEITNKTSLLVLSILSIPPFTIENEQKEENRAKIANLLSSSGTLPKRNELINIMKSTNLLELVNPEILSVFQLLEEEFDLLNFSMKAEKLFEILSQTPEYSIYIPALKVNLVYKTLLSLREVYKTITIAKLHKILHIIDLPIIENIILMAHVQEFINVKINHNLNVLIFGSNEQNSGFFLNERLNILANGLQNLRNSLGVNIAEEKSKEKQVFLKENAKKYLNESGRSLEMRKIRINKPEINQRFQKEKQKEDEDRRFIDEQKREEIEKIRIKEEQKKQKEKDIKESELNRKVKLLSELIKAKGPQVVKINGKKLESYNREELAEIEMKDLEDIKAMMQTKEKENTESKHKRTFQKVDFTERVKREGEFSIIEGFWQSDNQEVSELIKKAAEEYKRNFEIRRNLVETNGFRMNYVKENLEKRKSAYEKDLAKFRKDIEKEFKQSVLERALELLEKQKKRDDEEKKKREEAEKIRLLEEQKFKKGGFLFFYLIFV